MGAATRNVNLVNTGNKWNIHLLHIWAQNEVDAQIVSDAISDDGGLYILI